MDNNKNHMKTREKSNAELRKIFFQHGGDIGIENGVKMGVQSSGKKYHKDAQFSKNK